MKRIIRKNILVLSIVAIMLGTMFAGSIQAFAASGDTTVYITKSGDCYHSGGCSSLRKSKIPTTLQDAVDKGYRACSKCKPGSLDATSTTSATAAKASTTKSASTVVNNTTVVMVVNDAVEALKNYKGNNSEFNAYTYYVSNTDLQTAIGPDGDKLLKHFNEYGKAEGRKAK